MTLSLSRLLMLAAFVCLLIAALIVAGLPLGLPWAWAFGGLAAWALAGAV